MRAFIFFLLISLPFSAHPATLHVSPEGTGTDGLSWETAYPTITEAVIASTTGDSIWVRAGVYEEAVEVTKEDSKTTISTDCACRDEPLIAMPTVVTCAGESSYFTLCNIQSLSRIEFFTLPPDNHPIIFNAQSTGQYTYTPVESGDGSVHHVIESIGQLFPVNEIEIEFSVIRHSECPFGPREPPSVVEVVNAIGIENSEGPSVIDSENGTIFPATDYSVTVLRSYVYHSDGVTPFEGANVTVTRIDSFPVRVNGFSFDSGRYLVEFPTDLVDDETKTIDVNVTDPSSCTSVVSEDLLWDRRGSGPVVHNFILPIPPPIQNPRSDINLDNKIDSEDLLILLEEWGRVSGVR